MQYLLAAGGAGLGFAYYFVGCYGARGIGSNPLVLVGLVALFGYTFAKRKD